MKVGIIIFCEVEINDGSACFIRDSRCWFAPLIAMNKEFFAVFFISDKHTVNMSFGASKG